MDGLDRALNIMLAIGMAVLIGLDILMICFIIDRLQQIFA